MSYAQLDEHFDEHPKYQNLELEHFGLMACGISYCNRLLTDGKIPMKVVRGFGASGRGVEIAEELVAAGVWSLSVAGYEIVGFLDHNPSRAKVLARREAERARKEAFRTGVKRAAVPQAVPAGHVADVRAEGAADSLGRSTSLHFTSLQGKQETREANDSEAPASERRPSRPPPADPFGATFLAEAWREGVSLATTLPCTPLKPYERSDLDGFVSVHSGGLSGDALKAWVRDTAKAFVEASDAKFGFTPKRCAVWLDSGRPPKHGARAMGGKDTSHLQKTDAPDAPWRKNMKVSEF